MERLKRFINEEIRHHQYLIMAASHAQQVAASLALAAKTDQPEASEKPQLQTTLIDSTLAQKPKIELATS